MTILRSRPIRAIPYLAVATLTGGLSAWFSQDWSGWLIVISFSAVGLFLLWRRPREVVAWLLVGAAILFPWVGSSLPGSASQVVDGNAEPVVTLFAWLNSWCSSLFFGAFIALAALFPAGRFPAGRLGIASRIAVATPVAFAVVLAFAPSVPITFVDGTTAAVGLPLAVFPDWPGWAVLQVAVYVAVLTALAVSVGTLIVRFRRARGSERAQDKWLLAALAATLGSVIFAFAMILLVDPVGTWMWVAAVLAYPMIPIAIGIAIRRYHLYDIDRVVSRSIAYLVVTGLLLVIFGGLVVGLQAVLAALTQGQTLAVAASTLAALALFQPLHRRVQAAVDRRFDRASVDAQRTIDGFAGQLRDEVDLTTLRGVLVATAESAVRPDGVALWVRNVSNARSSVVS